MAAAASSGPIPKAPGSAGGYLLATVPAKARPGHDPGWTPARRLIFRTYDGLSNLNPLLCITRRLTRGVCVPKTLSDDVLTVR